MGENDGARSNLRQELFHSLFDRDVIHEPFDACIPKNSPVSVRVGKHTNNVVGVALRGAKQRGTSRAGGDERSLCTLDLDVHLVGAEEL